MEYSAQESYDNWGLQVAYITSSIVLSDSFTINQKETIPSSLKYIHTIS